MDWINIIGSISTALITSVISSIIGYQTTKRKLETKVKEIEIKSQNEIDKIKETSESELKKIKVETENKIKENKENSKIHTNEKNIEMQTELTKELFKGIMQNPETANQSINSLIDLAKRANEIKENKQ